MAEGRRRIKKDVVTNSVWEQDSAQQAAVFGRGVRTCHTQARGVESTERGGNGQMESKYGTRTKTAREEHYLEAKQILSFSSCLSLWSSLKLKKMKKNQDSVKWGMRTRSLSPSSLPDCLSFQPPLSRDAVTLVSPGYCYEFSIVISWLCAAVTELDEWHARR